MGRTATCERLLGAAIQMRVVSAGLDDIEQRAGQRQLACALDLLYDEIGPTVPKRVAARVLDVDVSSLDRWIARGAIDTGSRPGSSRQEISTVMTVELAVHLSRWRHRPPDALRLALGAVWRARARQHWDRELAAAALS